MVLTSVKSIKGRREYMEDRYAYLEADDIIIAMVCDGHGGSTVAEKTANELPKILLETLQNTTGTNVNHGVAIRNAIIKWGNSMAGQGSGSTLTGIAAKADTVYFYNIGDSRTCAALAQGTFVYHLNPIFNYHGQYHDSINIDYSRFNFYCTIDHDHTNKIEDNRVAAMGGEIKDGRLNGILSVTRALGDKDVGIGIGYIPDITWVKRNAIIKPIVMYSDGIYELQRYQSSANFEDRFLYAMGVEIGAEPLVDYAYDNGSDDNLTVLIVTV